MERYPISMKSYDKHKNAAGRDADFGAIFMTSSATKQECFQRRLFGLPSSQSQFVKQVKAGMILFLFDYDKRELHGVYKACCDGAMNIVPEAFGSSGMQFPAQVKFTQIWDCKPLKESIFRDAIRENYFLSKKFYFGLSEKQVHRLLNLFSKTKLERELPGKQLIRMKNVKPACYPEDKVGTSIDGRMHVKIVKNEQDTDGNTLPFTMHNYQRDSFQYNGEVDDIGFNGRDIIGNRLRGNAELGLDFASGHVGDHLALKGHCTFSGHDKEHCTFSGHDKEHSMDMHLRPAISGGLSQNLSSEFRVHEDDKLHMSDRLMSEHNAKPGQRMVFADDMPCLHNSDVNMSLLSSKPMLDPDSLVHNQHRATSAMLHPVQAHVSDNSCVAQGDLSSQSVLYDPDALGFDIRQPSSVRIRLNDRSKSILGSASPSNNYRRNIIHSLNDQPSHMHTKMKDTNQFQDGSYGLVNHVPLESNWSSMPFYAVQGSERFATVEHEVQDSFPLKSSSVPLSPSNIEPYSSLYSKYNSHVSNDVHSIALEENLGHEMTLQENNDTCSLAVPWENGGDFQFQHGDPLIHEQDPAFECCRNSGSFNSGYEEKKSVFSRLSVVQGFNIREYGSNNWRGEYDVHTCNSVDEVMDMVRQSHNQWRMKRKSKPLVKHSKAENLRDRKQISSSRSTGASSEKSLDDTSMDMTTASEGKTNHIAEETRFVDFKRRSHVRKINEETNVRGSNEGVISEDKGLVQQKKRKLIRPNFSKSTTSDDKDINLGLSQNLQVSLSQESSNPKDDSKSCNTVVHSEEDIKIDGKEPALVCQTHFNDKSNSAMECVNSEGGGKPTDRQSISNIGLNDGSECPEHLNSQDASSSASCETKSFHDKEGLCMKDDIKSIFPDTELQHSIGQAHEEEKVLGASIGTSVGEGTLKEGRQLFSLEVKDGSEFVQNFANENASIATCEKSNCNIEKDSNMNHESQCVSGVAESSVPCEDSFKKEKASLPMTENVDRPRCYSGEAAIDSRMPETSNSDVNSVGINISVDRQGRERN